MAKAVAGGITLELTMDEAEALEAILLATSGAVDKEAGAGNTDVVLDILTALQDAGVEGPTLDPIGFVAEDA